MEPAGAKSMADTAFKWFSGSTSLRFPAISAPAMPAYTREPTESGTASSPIMPADESKEKNISTMAVENPTESTVYMVKSEYSPAFSSLMFLMKGDIIRIADAATAVTIKEGQDADNASEAPAERKPPQLNPKAKVVSIRQMMMT